MMSRNYRKKNEPGVLGEPLALSCDLGDLETCETTSSASGLFCQVRFSFLQADLFGYRVLNFDLFGQDTAGDWYD